MKYLTYYKSPIGILGIVQEEDGITEIFFEGEVSSHRELKETETPLLKEAKKQLEEYFNKSRRTFDLPLAPKGTEFMKNVWKALQGIPYGETRSYKDIAEKIDHPKACRAVGMANHRNPIAIAIPCHRVIGAKESLVGYAGGLELKKYLLELEKNSK